MIETGTILQNRYRVDKQIGQGGMGNVYVATDERFKSIVAIKETIFEDANLRKAFEREARLLNSLKHIALPRVSDHFDEQQRAVSRDGIYRGRRFSRANGAQRRGFPARNRFRLGEINFATRSNICTRRTLFTATSNRKI